MALAKLTPEHRAFLAWRRARSTDRGIPLSRWLDQTMEHRSGLRQRFVRASRPAKKKFEPNAARLVAIRLILRGNSNGYRMGQVNTYGESRASERVFGSMRARRGEQPAVKKWRDSWAFSGGPPNGERVRDRHLGGGRGPVVEPSSVIGLRGSRAPSWHRLRGWSSGRGHSSVRGRRVRPPQVGVRRGPGASISESAWSPIERARPVTAEGSSMSPLPRVPAGRFRRSGTRDLAEAAGRLFCGLWSRGNSGRRSDATRGASEGAGVKAGEAPGLAGPGLDARASRCGTVIIGSMPRSDLLRPRHRLAHRARAANGSQCRPATSGA